MHAYLLVTAVQGPALEPNCYVTLTNVNASNLRKPTSIPERLSQPKLVGLLDVVEIFGGVG